jgi:Fur family iron response transcriptional regulator
MKETKEVKRTCLRPEEIEARLREAGVQPTLQRLSLCRFVLCEADHPTAEEVKQWADKNLDKISLATVYNTLNTLVDAGILRAFRLPHSDKVIYDANIDDHFHFLCEKSGKLYDVMPGDFNYEIKLPKKYKVKSLEIVFKGEIK